MFYTTKHILNVAGFCILLVIGISTKVLAEEKLPGQFIRMGLYSMYIDCLGDQSPTVVIDVGLGDSAAKWYQLAKRLSQHTRTCVYDRAGYGWSDAGKPERTTAEIVKELRKLLKRANIPGKFVLVGHSFGGFTARYFSSRYPDETVGLVLIESSHPDQIYRLSALDYNKTNRSSSLFGEQSPALDYMDDFEQYWYSLNLSRKALFAQMRELKYFPTSAYQVKHAVIPEDIPIAVISRSKTQLPEIDGISLEDIWHEMQRDLLTLSHNSWREIVEGSGHDLYHYAPDVIVENVLKVIEYASRNENSSNDR